MGAKTWMLVYGDGDVAATLRSDLPLDREATDNLVQKLFPDEKLEPIEDGDLSYTCPTNKMIFAGCFGGVSVVAAKEFGGDYPSKIAPRFIDESLGGVIYSHAMHSVVDWLAFSKWEKGKLVRSLSISPDDGVIEDIGERLDFEIAYWQGAHPAVDPEEVGEATYPLPFHPLELGEEALKHFFGYQLEGYADENLLEPETIPLAGYRRLKPWWKFW